MSIKSTLSNLVNGDGADPDQAEVDFSLEAIRAAEKLQAELFAKRDTRGNQLAKAEQDLAEAALAAELSGDDLEYQKALGSITTLRQDLKRIDDAYRAAGARIQAAKQGLHAATRERHVKTAKKECTLIAKYLALLADHLAGAIHAYSKVLEHADRLSAASPVALYGQGLMLSQIDINRAVGLEIARLKPDAGMNPDNNFPGALPLIYGDVSKVPTLVEAFDQCRARIIELVAEGPSAAPTVSEVIDPDAQILTPLNEQRLDVGELTLPPDPMASVNEMGRKTYNLDHRVTKEA